MTLDNRCIGLRIKHARSNNNLSQEQLADMLGISRNHISLIETGSRGISLEMLVDISNILQEPITELLADNLTSSKSEASTAISRILL